MSLASLDGKLLISILAGLTMYKMRVTHYPSRPSYAQHSVQGASIYLQYGLSPWG
jgi:hypothetical protein